MEPHGQARGTFLIDPSHHRLKISPKSSAHASGLSALASLAAESAGVPRLLVRIQPRLKAVVFFMPPRTSVFVLIDSSRH